MEKIDVAVIGAGAVGLAVAREMAGDKKYVFVFERHRSFGRETSSRNSEVIHSGIYYPDDTFKAKTCIEGNRLLYKICEANGISYNKTGKLIVAVNEDEITGLETLFLKGKKKELEGIKMLSSVEVNAMEPEIKAVQAVFLPSTGIIDTHSLMEFYSQEIRTKGADIVYDAEVIDIEFTGNEYIVTTSSGGEKSSFSAISVINCGGLESDRISEMAGVKDYCLHYCKGDYFRLGNGKNTLVKKLVYPVVKENDISLGIHMTPDLAGGIRLGPDAEYTGSREKEYGVSGSKRDIFLNDVKRFAPFIGKEDLFADTSGIRPKLQGPGDDFKDFVIKDETDKGFPGFINLVGIESPGLTASPSIAKVVAAMAKKNLT